MSGCAAASPDSVAVTATFFTVAVAITLGLHALTGGAAVTRGVRWSALGVGLVFGFLLTASGLGDYDTIHDGLLLRDPYIFLMMASAMGTAFPVSPSSAGTAAPGTRAGCRCRTTASSAGTSTAGRSSGWASASVRPAPG